MEKSIQRGKLYIFAIIVSSLIFLILHNNELYFQEYGNRIILNIFRLAIFAPLLYFLYKKHNWARYTLAILSSLLVIAGIIGFLLFLKDWMKPADTLYLGSMMLCLIFNASVLFFSEHLQYNQVSNMPAGIWTMHRHGWATGFPPAWLPLGSGTTRWSRYRCVPYLR